MTSPKTSIDLREHIRDIPDFPKPGILFKDIAPLLADPTAYQATIAGLVAEFSGRGIETVAAAEARGFLFGAPLALSLGAGFVPIRKPGKLPGEVVSLEYLLEYGADRLEIQKDALSPGRRVLLIDDVLATGGTILACCELIESVGAEVVACAFVLELSFLKGRSKLGDREVFSLVKY